MTNFSTRFNLSPKEVPITVWNDAPCNIRNALLTFFKESSSPNTHISGGSSEIAREILTEFPLTNKDGYKYAVHYPVQSLISIIKECPWFYVYDIAEYMHNCFQRDNPSAASNFQDELNTFFYANGFGFEMTDGRIMRRDNKEVQEFTLNSINTVPNLTVQNELREAWIDLSRRPDPDLTGAITHSVAAIECFARSVCNTKDTLGDIVKKNKSIFSPP